MKEEFEIDVYVTKNALTKGIRKLSVERCNDDCVCYFNGLVMEYYSKHNWFTTREAAVERAELLRQGRIITLKKQLEKLESMKFTAEDLD